MPVKSNPTVQTVTIDASGGADVTLTFPAGTTAFRIANDDGTKYRVAFNAGDITAGTYYTVDGAVPWEEDDLILRGGKKLYLRSDDFSSHVLRVLLWQ